LSEEVERGKWDKPLIIPPGGGEKVPYHRVSSYGEVIDDTYNLRLWEQRAVAEGLAQRPDLLNLIAANRIPEKDPKAESKRKKKQNDSVKSAKEAGGANVNSNTGTALHLVTERIDLGEEVPLLPEPYQADVEAYKSATQMLTPVAVEKFLVCDYLQAAGTTDRLYRIGDRELLTIGDTKTGKSLDFGIVKIAIQLAIYSRSKGYDPKTGEREELGIDQDWGLIVFLPAGSAKCELIWLDLNKGWSLALLAQDIRDARKLGKKDLTRLVDFEELIA
jgi:hypothetical protein